ncbi:hypothetical protein ACLOJK_039542 [Asimina triloba]
MAGVTARWFAGSERRRQWISPVVMEEKAAAAKLSLLDGLLLSCLVRPLPPAHGEDDAADRTGWILTIENP